MNNRPDFDHYFMEFCKVASARSTCLRRKVGAVIVKDSMIISTGYNGAPKGIMHCSRFGCRREALQVPSGQRHELCRGLHAEQNAIIQAACIGVPIKGSILYCTNSPCSICMKMIINAEIREVVFEERYDDPLSDAMASEAGLSVTQLKFRDLNNFGVVQDEQKEL